MNFRKIINRKLRHEGEGVQVAGDLNAVVAGNVGRKGSGSHVSSRQSTRIVQRSGETVVDESRSETSEGGADGEEK
jgi:hypothetical protein